MYFLNFWLCTFSGTRSPGGPELVSSEVQHKSFAAGHPRNMEASSFIHQHVIAGISSANKRGNRGALEVGKGWNAIVREKKMTTSCVFVKKSTRLPNMSFLLCPVARPHSKKGWLHGWIPERHPYTLKESLALVDCLLCMEASRLF